jgi:hypothetical protein
MTSFPPAPAALSRALLRQLPPAPRPEDYVGRGATIDESPSWERDRRYVRLEECEALWAANQSVNHPDVSLPHGWHLNHARVSVLLAPPVGPRLDAEIRRRISNLP